MATFLQILAQRLAENDHAAAIRDKCQGTTLVVPEKRTERAFLAAAGLRAVKRSAKKKNKRLIHLSWLLHYVLGAVRLPL